MPVTIWKVVVKKKNSCNYNLYIDNHLYYFVGEHSVSVFRPLRKLMKSFGADLPTWKWILSVWRENIKKSKNHQKIKNSFLSDKELLAYFNKPNWAK